MLEFQGDLYAGTTSMTTGCRLFRYDGPGWTQVNQDGFGRDNNSFIRSMAVYDHGGTEYLYVGTINQAGGGEVWRTAGTGGPPFTDWTLVGRLRAATRWRSLPWPFSSTAARSTSTRGPAMTPAACGLWRTAGSGGPPYTDWTQVAAAGFGDANNGSVFSLTVMGNRLFAATENGSTGCEVWASSGTGGPPYADWAQANADGFGDVNNRTASSMAVVGADLYVGTCNYFSGGEVWRSACTGAAPYRRLDPGERGRVRGREQPGYIFPHRFLRRALRRHDQPGFRGRGVEVLPGRRAALRRLGPGERRRFRGREQHPPELAGRPLGAALRRHHEPPSTAARYGARRRPSGTWPRAAPTGAWRPGCWCRTPTPTRWTSPWSS